MTEDKKVGIIFSECNSPSSPKFGNFHMKNKNHAPSLIKKISRMILQFYGLVNFQPTEEDFFSVFYVSGSSGKISTAWKVSKYGVTSGPYFPKISVFSPNTGQKYLRIWTLFTHCRSVSRTLSNSVMENLRKFCILEVWQDFKCVWLSKIWSGNHSLGVCIRGGKKC